MIEGLCLATVVLLAFAIIVAFYNGLISRRKCRAREARRRRQRTEHFQERG